MIHMKMQLYDYIEQVLSEVDKPLMCASSTSPATRNLFTINDEGIKLGKKDAEAFHRNVARLLFLSKQKKTRHTDGIRVSMYESKIARH